MDFRVFGAMPCMGVILRPDARKYTIVAVSNDYLLFTGLERVDLIGKRIFDFLPTDPGNPYSGTVQRLTVPVLRYGVPRNGGNAVFKYWQVKNAPLPDQSGDLVYWHLYFKKSGGKP